MNMSTKIRKMGKTTGKFDNKERPICAVKCQGCGEDIRSDEDLENVDYVKTKRGTEWFFHRCCRDKIWKRKII